MEPRVTVASFVHRKMPITTSLHVRSTEKSLAMPFNKILFFVHVVNRKTVDLAIRNAVVAKVFTIAVENVRRKTGQCTSGVVS